MSKLINYDTLTTLTAMECQRYIRLETKGPKTVPECPSVDALYMLMCTALMLDVKEDFDRADVFYGIIPIVFGYMGYDIDTQFLQLMQKRVPAAKYAKTKMAYAIGLICSMYCRPNLDNRSLRINHSSNGRRVRIAPIGVLSIYVPQLPNIMVKFIKGRIVSYDDALWDRINADIQHAKDMYEKATGDSPVFKKDRLIDEAHDQMTKNVRELKKKSVRDEYLALLDKCTDENCEVVLSGFIQCIDKFENGPRSIKKIWTDLNLNYIRKLCKSTPQIITVNVNVEYDEPMRSPISWPLYLYGKRLRPGVW